MKKFILLSLLSVLLISVVSAEILLLNQPKTIYNLGDTISVPVIIKTINGVSGNLQMNLLCNGQEINFYKNGINLNVGEERRVDAELVLTSEIIGLLKGFCTIKITLKDEFLLTQEFQISNKLLVDVKTTQKEFNPGDEVIIDGEAIKESGEMVDGFVELTVMGENDSTNTTYQNSVNNGFFSINFPLKKNADAGNYDLSIRVFEKNGLGEITNLGDTDYIISVKQVPTSLEILFETAEVEPGTSMKVKGILHDQTGEKIESSVILTIKDDKQRVWQQTEMATDEFLEFPVAHNEPPKDWSVVGVSNQIISEAPFKIAQKILTKSEIINRTLIITNLGNVPYNNTLLVKIGDGTVSLDVSLNIDESKRYVLSAPDGEYNIEVLENGQSAVNREGIFLTGKVIDVKEISKFRFSNYPFAWMFVVAILGLVAFIVFKKGYKRSFFGYITKEKAKEDVFVPLKEDSKLKTRNKAEISLSLKGDKQITPIVCLKIKNLREIEKGEGSIEETIQNVINLAEQSKGVVYENQDYIFFLISPMKTRTFKNEMPAVRLALGMKQILLDHNKKFKQKIDFGISLSEGDVIAQPDKESFKFMSFGTFMTSLKKIATVSHEDVLISDKIKSKVSSVIKTDKQNKEGLDVYTIREIREESEENKKFIRNFLKKVDEKGKED